MSATPRLFVSVDLASGGTLELDSAQSHYLGRVMRLAAGDPVRVFNGRDGEFDAIVATVAKRAVTLSLGGQTREPSVSPDLWLAYAPIKKAASDLIVEKAVELGVRRILPVRTQRSNAPAVRSDRLERIVIEAAEQTERMDIPEVGEECSLEAFLNGWPEDRSLLFCDESGDDEAAPWGGSGGVAPSMAEVVSNLTGRPVAILIGPEGGFSPEERLLLRGQSFVLPISLGPRILRAETAAIAAMAVWQAVCGDWAGRAPEN